MRREEKGIKTLISLFRCQQTFRSVLIRRAKPEAAASSKAKKSGEGSGSTGQAAEQPSVSTTKAAESSSAEAPSSPAHGTRGALRKLQEEQGACLMQLCHVDFFCAIVLSSRPRLSSVILGPFACLSCAFSLLAPGCYLPLHTPVCLYQTLCLLLSFGRCTESTAQPTEESCSRRTSHRQSPANAPTSHQSGEQSSSQTARHRPPGPCDGATGWVFTTGDWYAAVISSGCRGAHGRRRGRQQTELHARQRAAILVSAGGRRVSRRHHLLLQQRVCHAHEGVPSELCTAEQRPGWFPFPLRLFLKFSEIGVLSLQHGYIRCL